MDIRPRRNRRSAAIRGMARETRVDVEQLVYPLFLEDGKGIQREISSLPGNYRWSLDMVLGEIASCVALGLQNFILFPAVEESLKDKTGTHSYAEENFYLHIIQAIKSRFPEVTLISDVALDPYSSDGHDGIVKQGKILNDETLPVLGKMAVAQAQAGIDIIGPSDMMDGRVGYIRDALDAEGYTDTGIMSYTAKYASAFYGPFRDALDSAPKVSEEIPADKKTYQMDPANKREALREGALDYEEGADFLMVKPALHYMDVIHVMKEHFDVPVAAYHVSGECAMLRAASENGWLEFDKAMPETLTALARAGTDVIITYFAKDFAAMRAAGKV